MKPEKAAASQMELPHQEQVSTCERRKNWFGAVTRALLPAAAVRVSVFWICFVGAIRLVWWFLFVSGFFPFFVLPLLLATTLGSNNIA